MHPRKPCFPFTHHCDRKKLFNLFNTVTYNDIKSFQILKIRQFDRIIQQSCFHNQFLTSKSKNRNLYSKAWGLKMFTLELHFLW